jgi:hypothetical protein
VELNPMSETAAEYTTRILGYLGNGDALATLEATPGILTRLVASLDDAKLARRPAPTKWSIQEILAHLADVELVMGYRIRRILASDGVSIEAYDQNRWAEIGRYDRVPTAESLDRIRVQRGGSMRLLRSLRSEQMQQHGIHSERGKETIVHTTRMWAGHDLNHLRQIEAILAP